MNCNCYKCGGVILNSPTYINITVEDESQYDNKVPMCYKCREEYCKPHPEFADELWLVGERDIYGNEGEILIK